MADASSGRPMIVAMPVRRTPISGMPKPPACAVVAIARITVATVLACAAMRTTLHIQRRNDQHDVRAGRKYVWRELSLVDRRARAREPHDPVGLPGCAVVVGKCLFPRARARVPQEPDAHWS